MKLNFFTFKNTDYIFNLLEECQGVSQVETHHPEKDVFNHCLQTANWAFRETKDTDLILAALLHDVGKKVNSYGHEKIGANLLNGYVSDKTLFLIENHMKIWSYLNGEMQKLSKCIFLASHPWLSELIQLARWDKKGRDGNKKLIYNKEMIIKRLNLINFENVKD